MPRPTSPNASPRGEEPLLSDDLSTLVSLGLVEVRDEPQGRVYALTDLGRHTPEFGT